MKQIVIVLMGVLLIVSMVGGVLGQGWHTITETGKIVDTPNPPTTKPTIVSDLNTQNFQEAFNTLQKDDQLIKEYIKKEYEVELSEANYKDRTMNGDKMVGPDGVEQDLNNLKGKKLEITQEGMKSTSGGSSVSTGNGIATFANSAENPSGGCLYEGSVSIGYFNVWELKNGCYANPDGGFAGLEFNFQPSDANKGTLASLTNNFLFPLVSAQSGSAPTPGTGTGTTKTPTTPRFTAPLGIPPAGGGAEAQLLQMVQSIMGFLQPFFEAIRNNNKGKVNVAKEPGGVTFGYNYEAAVALEKDKETKAALQQKNLGTVGEALARGNTLIASNTQTAIPKQGVSIVKDKTTQELNGISGNSEFPVKTDGVDENVKISTIGGILPLIKNLNIGSSITGNIVSVDAQPTSGQSIQFIDHDLNINGHDISFYNLKTFNNIEFGGNNLHLFNGNIHMAFNGQRIMYSRLVYNAPYGIKRIKNKLEINQNEFILQHYTNMLGELTDKNKIISVGDITKSPRKGPYTKLKFNKHRINTMFS